MDVVTDRKALAAFRRRALHRYPNEYLETLWGCVNTDGSISIIEFRAVELEKVDNPQEAVETLDDDAGRYGIKDGPLTQLGTIHTHPDGMDCAPSEEDWADAIESGELVMGLLLIQKNKTRRRTWSKFFVARALCNLVIK